MTNENIDSTTVDQQNVLKRFNLISASELCSDEYRQNEIMKKKIRRDAAKQAIEEKKATFEDLVVIEPALQWLLDDAIDFKKQSFHKRNVCANDRWYGYGRWDGLGIKKRL